MPNAIIAMGMTTIVGNAHLHYKQNSEVEDIAVVDGITEDNVDYKEDDVVGDSKVPKEHSAHTALIASRSGGPASELQQVQVPHSVPRS